jgi:carbohydrate-selective porin OprB
MVPDEEIERLRDQLVLNVRRAYLKRLLDEAKRQTRTAAGIEDQQVAAAEVVRLKRELIAAEQALR